MREDEMTVETLIRPSRRLGRASISVVEGKARGLAAELLPGVPVSIGKSPDNQLVLDDRTVSRYHLELTLRRGDIEVRDLESMNGTYIGEVRVDRVLVRPGARLTIGTTTLLLSAEPSEAGSLHPEPEEAAELPGVVARSPAMRQVAQS